MNGVYTPKILLQRKKYRNNVRIYFELLVATDLKYFEEALLPTNVKTVFDLNKRESDLKMGVRMNRITEQSR